MKLLSMYFSLVIYCLLCTGARCGSR